MTDLDIEAFKAWLRTGRGRGGRPVPETTVGAYARAAASIAREGDGARRYATLLGAARKLLEWPGTPPTFRPVLERLRAEGPASHGRAKPARSVPDATWRRFCRAVEKGSADDPAVAVLRVLADTGLRIGDVLRIPVAELRAGARTGRLDLTVKGGRERILHWDGAPGAWEALLEHAKTARGATIVAHVVRGGSDPTASGAAYKACSRAMKELGASVDPEERWHLHRMRRTVLVQALEETHDIVAVQELGGHESIVTTQRYLDEVRAKETAELQRKLTAKRRG